MIYSIPAIDLIDGQVARLYQGDYRNVTMYAKTPLQIVKQISDLNYSNIHIIDLMGAKTGIFTISPLLEDILSLGLSIQVGGGIRTLDQAKALITKGIDRVIVSTSALVDQNFFPSLIKFIGAKRIVLSLDIRNGLIATHGWRQYSKKTVDSVLQSFPLLRNLIVTDINQDGTLSSSINHDLYFSILKGFPNINLMAAGGISSIESIKKLDQAGCAACIIGKAYHEIDGFKEEIVAKGFHRRKKC